jgi:hypothetical protein
MSLVFWGRRRVLMVLFFCCRPGACPAPGRLLGCGRGPCPVFADCPLADAGQSYRWSLRLGERLIGITLLLMCVATGAAQVEGKLISTPQGTEGGM